MRTPLPRRLNLPAAIACALLLAACGSDRPPLFASVKRAPKPAPIVDAVPIPTTPTAAGSVPSAASAASAASDEELPSVIYFDSDAYQVKDSYKPLLEAVAKRLVSDPSLHLRIDGHTDDSGPADYNLELARMRAQMVMKQLLSLGVPRDQLQAVGHGKGKPAAKGAGLQTQAANRRVELTYR
jgi:outer membrane protein OmpA-like peptidoglycan-associated protein